MNDWMIAAIVLVVCGAAWWYALQTGKKNAHNRKYGPLPAPYEANRAIYWAYFEVTFGVHDVRREIDLTIQEVPPSLPYDRPHVVWYESMDFVYLNPDGWNGHSSSYWLAAEMLNVFMYRADKYDKEKYAKEYSLCRDFIQRSFG